MLIFRNYEKHILGGVKSIDIIGIRKKLAGRVIH